MPERQPVGTSKITVGWRVQFPADARRALEKREGRPIKVGDRVAFFVQADGRIYLERMR
jgi:hypothetical protein